MKETKEEIRKTEIIIRLILFCCLEYDSTIITKSLSEALGWRMMAKFKRSSVSAKNIMHVMIEVWYGK